jgi:APA family basic amino acid/polyamine antiporter
MRRLFATQRYYAPAAGVTLRRALGVPGLVAVGLGTMIGGIFTTIGVGMQAAGPGVLASFVLSGTACLFVALCYAELASMVPVAGSAYTYAYATLGEIVAWVIGWDLILEYGISVAPVAASWSGAVQALAQNAGFTLPAWAQHAHIVWSTGGFDLANSSIDLPAAFVVFALTCVLAAGIRESATTNTTLVVVQIVALVIFVLALLGAVRPAHFVPFMPLGSHGVIAGAALVFFAYIGFDTVTVASEEAKNARRDVPIGIIVSLIVGIVLYLAIAYVTCGIVPWQSIDKDAGLNDAVRHAGNPTWLATVVTLGAVAGTTTVMLTSMLGQIRIFYVMARDRMLPPWVAAIDPRTRTPLITTLLTGGLVTILAAAVPLDVLLALVNIGTLSAFTIVCLGVLVLRLREPHLERPFRAPFGPLVAVLGAALCLTMMIGGLSGQTWLRFVLWFLAGIAVYALYGYRNSRLRNESGR